MSKPRADQLYVAFEGPIGAGKTTLATMLSAHLGCQLVLEDLDHNEFLADFYADRARWALPMQLSFLGARHGQLRRVSVANSRPVVADYTYAKNGIFASLLLEGREQRLYAKLEQVVHSTLARPDVVVYLDADNDVLLDRIRRRGRDYEASITPSYLDDVRRAYERYFEGSSARADRVCFDTSTLDLTSTRAMEAFYAWVITNAVRVRAAD